MRRSRRYRDDLSLVFEVLLFETYFLLNSPLFSSFLPISVLILEINLAHRGVTTDRFDWGHTEMQKYRKKNKSMPQTSATGW